MTQYIIYFPEVTQDACNIGTDKLGVDVDRSTQVGAQNSGMFEVGELIDGNPEQLAYGAESMEMIMAQTSFASVNTSYMGAANIDMLESRLGPQLIPSVAGTNGVPVTVHEFQGTRAEFDAVTDGWDVQENFDVIVDVKGLDNIHSGSILIQGQSEESLGDTGIAVEELTLPLEELIEEAYEDQLAAVREFPMEPDMDNQPVIQHNCGPGLS